MERKQEKEYRVITWAVFGLTILRIGWFLYLAVTEADAGDAAFRIYWGMDRYYLLLIAIYLIRVQNALRDIRKRRNQ